MSRQIVSIRASEIRDRVATWAWEWDGKGRIERGTLCLLAGQSGAGKSTAMRWFVANLTRGTLDGCWLGQPQKVAYIRPAEESLETKVKPNLRAVGADMDLIHFLDVRYDGDLLRFNAKQDEQLLIEYLQSEGISVVVVDPLMSTIGGKTDINKNNEARAFIEPWARIAEAIDGVVIGIAHLKKSAYDVMTGITGSTAFVEVARSVFGFVKDNETSDRLMSQHKNSSGAEDLAIAYGIEEQLVRTDDGEQSRASKFVILVACSR